MLQITTRQEREKNIGLKLFHAIYLHLNPLLAICYELFLYVMMLYFSLPFKLWLYHIILVALQFYYDQFYIMMLLFASSTKMIFFNCDSLHVKLNNHYEAWRNKNKKHKKISKSVQKEPTVKRYLLILDLKPLRS